MTVNHGLESLCCLDYKYVSRNRLIFGYMPLELDSVSAGVNGLGFVDSSKTGYSLWKLTHLQLRQNGTIFNGMRFFWRAEHFQALFPIIPLLFPFASKSPVNFVASLNEAG